MWISLKTARSLIPAIFSKDETDCTDERKYSADASQYVYCSRNCDNSPRRPESILRSVVEKKPKQWSCLVKSADPTARTSHRSHWVYGGRMRQLQQWLRARLGEECRKIVEAIIDRTVPPMAEGSVRRTLASTVAEVTDALVKRQLIGVFTAPE